MNNFISIIGTIASVGSIPLAIYLYLKSKEDKIQRIKREIVKALSFQIGTNLILSAFEVQSIINSKSRENSLKMNSVSVAEIIEDLIAETVSNPLIEKDRKNSYLNNLKKIYYKKDVLDFVEAISDKIEMNQKLEKATVSEKLIQLINEQEMQKVELEKSIKKKQDSLSGLFGLIGIIATISMGVLIALPDSSINDYVLKIFNDSSELVTLITSLITGLLAILSTFTIQKFLKKDSNK